MFIKEQLQIDRTTDKTGLPTEWRGSAAAWFTTPTQVGPPLTWNPSCSHIDRSRIFLSFSIKIFFDFFFIIFNFIGRGCEERDLLQATRKAHRIEWPLITEIPLLEPTASRLLWKSPIWKCGLRSRVHTEPGRGGDLGRDERTKWVDKEDHRLFSGLPNGPPHFHWRSAFPFLFLPVRKVTWKPNLRKGSRPSKLHGLDWSPWMNKTWGIRENLAKIREERTARKTLEWKLWRRRRRRTLEVMGSFIDWPNYQGHVPPQNLVSIVGPLFFFFWVD